MRPQGLGERHALLRPAWRGGTVAILRAVEGGGAVAFPVVDVAAAHSDGILRFHQAASRPPRMFWITPLKTAAAAARGIAAKCCRARAAAMPPFCMPTSMLTVRAIGSG